MAEREIELPSPGPPGELSRALEEAGGLGGQPASAMMSDRRVVDPEATHRPSVCAKSLAVTSTWWPRARNSAITGRITSTWGEFVRSTQMFTGGPGPRAVQSASLHPTQAWRHSSACPRAAVRPYPCRACSPPLSCPALSNVASVAGPTHGFRSARRSPSAPCTALPSCSRSRPRGTSRSSRGCSAGSTTGSMRSCASPSRWRSTPEPRRRS